MYAEVQPEASEDPDLIDAIVGTPYCFGNREAGKWFPRAALDVPSYTTVYFQNARVSVAAPKPKHLPHRHLLPQEVYFYVRTKTAEVPFPLPEKDYPSSRYLHCAKVIPGHEAGGPTAHMVWSIHSVVGLKKHHCTHSGAPHRSMQLVIVVPSTQTINPGVEPAQLAFSPFNFAQLHLSRRLPRIIVPLFPRASFNEITRYVDAIQSGERLKALKALLGSWVAMSRRDLKRAGFKRWIRVTDLIDLRKGYRPPEPQIGSPYVELLPDRGEFTNLSRWPRLERAQHLYSSGSIKPGDESTRWAATSDSYARSQRHSSSQVSAAASASMDSLQLESDPLRTRVSPRPTLGLDPSLALDIEAAQRLQLGGPSPRRSLSPGRSPSPGRSSTPPLPVHAFGSLSARQYSDELEHAMYGPSGPHGALAARAAMHRAASSPRLSARSNDAQRGTHVSSVPFTPRGVETPFTPRGESPSHVRSASPRPMSSPRPEMLAAGNLANARDRLAEHHARQEALIQQQQNQSRSSPHSVRAGSPRRVHDVTA